MIVRLSLGLSSGPGMLAPCWQLECMLICWYPFFQSLWLSKVSLFLSPSPSLSPFHTGKRRYNIRLWKTFTDCFNCLPVAAILDEKIFCCHGGEGDVVFTMTMQIQRQLVVQLFTKTVYLYFPHWIGLSPDLQSMEQIRRIMRPTDVPDQGMYKWTDKPRSSLYWCIA